MLEMLALRQAKAHLQVSRGKELLATPCHERSNFFKVDLL
jgi:hypothetical protein